jgi:anion-transporting  ArsA/GET3 family ATPase
MSLAELIETKKIIVNMGPGGVGKTSISATLGIQAAVVGKKALVITIDPAMRLADALGLSDVKAGTHHLIPVSQLQQAGVDAKATLTVSMLDTGKSLAQMIVREVQDPKKRERILEHPFFHRMCNDLAGAREYAAMEEFYYLYMQGDYDLIIVDTPPTTQSLDFLQAPEKILDVLEHDGYRWLMRPALLGGKIGLKVLDFSGGYVVRTLSKFTGMKFLVELAGFVDLFSGLLDGFRQRAAALKEILRSDESAFVLVATPDPSQLDEVSYLYNSIIKQNLVPDTLVVNRVTPRPESLPNDPNWRDALIEELNSHSDNRTLVEQTVSAMEYAHQTMTQLSARDRIQLDKFRDIPSFSDSIVTVDMLDQDVHQISDLEKLRRKVF